MKTMLTGLLGLMLLAGHPALVSAQDHRIDHARRYRDGGRIELSAIDFEVLRSRLVTRECDRCERRRGEFRLGVFRVETRLYTEILGGHVIRTWRETAEFFDHCEESERIREY